MIWHGDSEVPASDVIILPGGFSFGDYLRCGAMAAHSPVMRELAARDSLTGLLNHRAGVPAVRETLPPEALYDWSAMTAAVAALIHQDVSVDEAMEIVQ